MKKIFAEFLAFITLIICVIPSCGCSDIEETYLRDNYCETSETESYRTSETEPSESQSSAAASTVPVKNEERKPETIQTAAIIPETKSRSEINGGTYTFTVDNVYSQGDYYTVSIVGKKRGDTFGEFRLVLLKDGAELDVLESDIPDGDRFLILDSVSEGLTYGCEIISNMRDFSAENHPDIIRLDFYKENEIEIPQYARYFAVFDGKLAELDIYENGVKKEPLGTHLELRGEGRMVQHLCVYSPSGKSLMVEKYEYIFDVENRRLNRHKVVFLGWNVDN